MNKKIVYKLIKHPENAPGISIGNNGSVMPINVEIRCNNK
jgi:hypothetical protein